MVTKGSNPAYISPEASAQALISRIGKVVWSRDKTMAWWGAWPECPEWVEAVEGANAIEPNWKIEEVFTAAEIVELKKTHGTTDVNWERAKAVKKCLIDGYGSISQAVSVLPTFGRTQISKDLAALKAAI